jgi:hypothetical protein
LVVAPEFVAGAVTPSVLLDPEVAALDAAVAAAAAVVFVVCFAAES